MSKKTLTTYEALKANETKRVRNIYYDNSAWWEPMELIDALNRGDSDATRKSLWEAEEPLIERWVTVDSDGKTTSYYHSIESAQRGANINETHRRRNDSSMEALLRSCKEGQ